MNDEQIERLLRKAPRPPAPAELLGELQSDIVAAPEGSGAAVPAACAGVSPATDSGASRPSGRRDARANYLVVYGEPPRDSSPIGTMTAVRVE